jgi:hypothetical protein
MSVAAPFGQVGLGFRFGKSLLAVWRQADACAD